jgi:hypothetical protein
MSPQPPSTIWSYAPQQAFWWYYDRPPEQLLAPARRAGTLVIVLGVLATLLGTCLVGAVPQLTDAQLAPLIEQVKRQQAGSEVAAAATPRLLRAGYAAIGVGAAVGGIVLIVVGILARGGGRGRLVVALIASLLVAAALLLVTLSGLAADPAAALAGLVVLAGPIALVAWAIRSTLEALREVPRIEAAMAQLRARRAAYASAGGVR